MLVSLCGASNSIAQLRGHGGPVRALAVSEDGVHALSGSFDSSAILWSLTSSKAEAVLRFHDGAINAVAFLHDGRMVQRAKMPGLRCGPQEATSPKGSSRVTRGPSSVLQFHPMGNGWRPLPGIRQHGSGLFATGARVCWRATSKM